MTFAIAGQHRFRLAPRCARGIPAAPRFRPHVTDAAEDRITVEWSADHRSCTARALDAASGHALLLRFFSPEPVLDPMARLRMENAAIAAVARLADA